MRHQRIAPGAAVGNQAAQPLQAGVCLRQSALAVLVVAQNLAVRAPQGVGVVLQTLQGLGRLGLALRVAQIHFLLQGQKAQVQRLDRLRQTDGGAARGQRQAFQRVNLLGPSLCPR